VVEVPALAAGAPDAGLRSVGARGVEGGVALALGATARQRPARISSTSSRMYVICSSATSISEKFPTGPFGPFSMNRLGKPGIEIDR
jgi:hypothetical protein